jgi:outer membrane protein assembly factor BamA
MRLVLLAFAIAGLAAGQPRVFPLVRLTVEGNRNLRAEQVVAASGLKLGQMVAQKEFDAARERLMESGFFETAGYKYGPSADKSGYEAVVIVAEVQQAYPVRFDRMAKTEAELRSALSKADPLFGEKIPGTEATLRRYAKLLEPLAGEPVIGRVVAEDTNDLRIVFQPARMPPSVAEVRFADNEAIQTTTLQNTIAGAAIGAVWREDRFRQILEASIRPLYEARGRVRVAFPKIVTEPVADVNGVRVTVHVAEGETYTLGEIAVDWEEGESKELLKAADLKQGDIANFDQIKAGLERMRARVRRNGYLKAEAVPERSIDDEKKTVSLKVQIHPGLRYVFSRLHIVGLDILTEPVIRKMWGLKEGQPFNPEYPDYFLNRVREDGVFDNLGKTRSEVKIDDKALAAEVTLYFR